MTWGPKLKKPTHFTKKEVLKHLCISEEELHTLQIYSGIYLKRPKHRRYKGRRTGLYFSRKDVRFFRNCAVYRFLLEKNRVDKQPNTKAMIESRYRDLFSLLAEFGDSFSLLAWAASNAPLLAKLGTFDENRLARVRATKPLFIELLDLFAEHGCIENAFVSEEGFIAKFVLVLEENGEKVQQSFFARFPCASLQKAEPQEANCKELLNFFDFHFDVAKLVFHTLRTKRLIARNRVLFENVFIELNFSQIEPEFVSAVCRAFGAKKCVSSDKLSEADIILVDKITNEGVHFQWVFDSINERVLKETSNYMEKRLPEHKNPFARKETNNLGSVFSKKEKVLIKSILENNERNLYKELKNNIHLQKTK